MKTKRLEKNMVAQDNEMKLMDPEQLSVALIEAQYA